MKRAPAWTFLRELSSTIRMLPAGARRSSRTTKPCYNSMGVYSSMGPNAAEPAAVIQKALCVLTGTQNVERWLGEVQLAELKHRSQALNEKLLETSIKLMSNATRDGALGELSTRMNSSAAWPIALSEV